MSPYLCRAAMAALLLMVSAHGCTKSNTEPEEDMAVEPDAGTPDAAVEEDLPYVPVGDSGKPLWDRPPKIDLRKVDLGKPKDGPVVVVKDKAVVSKEAYVAPDLPIANAVKVAAVQYGPNLFPFAPGCSDDLCGASHFITVAKNNGASYVVIPEGALPQKYYEPSPNVGDKPATAAPWSNVPVIRAMAVLADNLNITIVFQLITVDGAGAKYNTELAVDGNGTVVARHYKYYLYGEPWTPGTTCCDGLFPTPVGQAGMLICADINCIADLAVKGNCSSFALNTMNAYAAKKIYMTFFSSYWMSTGSLSPDWQPNQIQSKFAKHAGTYMIAANIISDDYHGGGIYRPDGTPIQIANTTTPSIAYAVIPKQGSPDPNPSPTTGKIVITELMINPSAVADDKGEYVELYNAGSSAVNLGGWSVRDGKPLMADWITSHTLAPGQYIVIGSNTNKATNGGAPTFSAWNSFGLANSSGKVQIHDAAGALVDEVSYGSGFPLPTGTAISLKSPGLDNSVGSNWCAEKTVWAGSAGDKGTPGAPAGCP